MHIPQAEEIGEENEDDYDDDDDDVNRDTATDLDESENAALLGGDGAGGSRSRRSDTSKGPRQAKGYGSSSGHGSDGTSSSSSTEHRSGTGDRNGTLVAKADLVVATGSSLTEIMRDLNFWLLSFMVMCGTGAGLTFINNLGQQVKALAGTNPADRPVSGDVAALHVVILSIANCFGRIVWGCVPC